MNKVTWPHFYPYSMNQLDNEANHTWFQLVINSNLFSYIHTPEVMVTQLPGKYSLSLRAVNKMQDKISSGRTRIVLDGLSLLASPRPDEINVVPEAPN